MKRNQFIRAGILTGAGLTLSKMVIASEKGSLNMNPICIYDNYIKGTRYYQKAIEKIDFTAPISPILVREPNNKYDRFAIAIHVQGRKIGYLPAFENVVIAKMMDAGVEIQLVIIQVLEKNDYIRDCIYVQLYTELLTSSENILQKDLDSIRADDADDEYRQGIII